MDYTDISLRPRCVSLTAVPNVKPKNKFPLPVWDQTSIMQFVATFLIDWTAQAYKRNTILSVYKEYISCTEVLKLVKEKSVVPGTVLI